MLHFLLVSAIFQQYWSEHTDAKTGQGDARIDARQLFSEYFRLFATQTSATVLGRPGWAGPAFLGHPVQPELAFGIGKDRRPPHTFLRHQGYAYWEGSSPPTRHGLNPIALMLATLFSFLELSVYYQNLPTFHFTLF